MGINIQGPRGTVNLRPLMGRAGPTGPGADVTGAEIEAARDAAIAAVNTVPQRVAEAIADDDTVALAAAAAVDDALAAGGVVTYTVAPQLGRNRAPDPQGKTSGGTISAPSYPLTRITDGTGLPAGFTYGLKTVRAGTLTSTISSVYRGAAVADPTKYRWSLTPGEVVSFRTYVFTDQPGAECRYDIVWKDAAGATVGSTNVGTYTPLAQNTWETRDRLGLTVPAGVAYAIGTITCKTISGANTVTGAIFMATGAQVVTGAALPAYRDGTYESWGWLGTPHESISKKVFVDRAEYDAVVEVTTASDHRLKLWAESDAWEPLTVTYNSDGVATSASAKWPDGSLGTWTATTINTAMTTVDAYKITHTNSGRMVTQAAVTRNADGAITVKPALTVGVIA